MATLQTIRTRAGLLVAIVIGLALFAFILGDLMGNGAPRGKRSVAEIGGKSIGVTDYMNREKSLRDFYELNSGGQNLDAETEKQIQQETWRRVVRETIMEESFEKLGIYVSTDELKTMVSGDQGMSGNPAMSEPHPIIRQMFSNPETGMLNRTVMTSFFNNLDNPQFAQQKQYWVYIENEILDEKMNEKYFTLVSKGFQPSSLDLKDYVDESGKSADFTYVSLPYSDVKDEEISVTESDLKAYFKKHLEKYKQTASRTFQYVVFEVVPSDKDIESARYWTEQTKAEFARITGDETPRYINGTSDNPFDSRYYTYDELPALIRDSVFNSTGEETFGPYRDGEAYKLARTHIVDMRADSVRVRHILLSAQAFGGNSTAMKHLGDSLVNVIENGGNFNALALEYSADESNRAIGGDLGWFTEGLMMTEFNDACFEGEAGDLTTAETRYGMHIIKIEEQSRPVKKIQMANIVRNIYASDETNQDYYNRAVKFRGKSTNLENFTEQAREFGLDPRFAPNITKDQQSISGVEDPRNLIKWAFTSEVNNVSNIFSQTDEKYIVAVLTQASEDGYAKLENVRAEVSLAVKKEKKAETLQAKLAGELSGVSNLNQFGQSKGYKIGEASQVKFANTYVTGVGLEPYIVGASMYLPVDQVSQALAGESGVFVLSVTSRDEPAAAAADLTSMKSRLQYTMESRSNYEAYQALMEAADVKDNRLEMYY